MAKKNEKRSIIKLWQLREHDTGIRIYTLTMGQKRGLRNRDTFVVNQLSTEAPEQINAERKAISLILPEQVYIFIKKLTLVRTS